MTLRPPIFDRDIATLNIADITKTSSEGVYSVGECVGRRVAEEADGWQPDCLLCHGN